VTGASTLEIDLDAREVRVDGTTLSEGDIIAIDGTTGAITTADVPLVEPKMSRAFETVLAWSDALRSLGVRANADTPRRRAARPAPSARRASACAGPSTCSWPPTASRRCKR